MNPVPTEPVVVSNADLLSSVDFDSLVDFHIEQGSDATITVCDYEVQNPFGVIRISDGKVVEIIEKPVMRSKISAGIYVLDPSIIENIPHGEPCDMPSILQSAISGQFMVTAFQLHEDWMDIGRLSGLIASKVRIRKL